MPVIFSKRTGRPCCEDAIEIANGEFIFFIFGGGAKSFQSRFFFLLVGVNYFFLFSPLVIFIA